MPPSTGLFAASIDRTGSGCAPAEPFAATGLERRSRQGRRFLVAVFPSALMALCGTPSYAQTTAVGDRYSGETYVQPAYRQAGASGPTLSWPGKTEAVARLAGEPMRTPAYAYTAQSDRQAAPAVYPTPVPQTPADQPAAYQAPAYAADRSQAPAQPTRVYGAPPVMPWYQRYAGAGGAPASSSAAPTTTPTRTGAPKSIYDPAPGQGGAATLPAATASPVAALGPPAPAPAPAATAVNDGETARFYSLHRQYGLTPDPDPIPPQFFTQTADLSDPPGPSPVYKAAVSTGGSATAVHSAPSDESTSTLGQP